MQKKSGFTLVELLAVIVILAVLVLIAVPSVIKLLENTKKNAFSVEAENIIKSAKNAYSNNALNGITQKCYTLEDIRDFTDKNFEGYSGSVYIDTDTNTFKIWLSKDDYIVNGSTSGNIEVIELAQMQSASSTCEDIEILACTTGKYNLYINAMGGKFGDNTQKKTFELFAGTTQEIEEPTKAEYTFNGWSIIGNPESFQDGSLIMGEEDVMLSAEWVSTDVPVHILYVDPDGGTWNNFTTTQEYGMEEYKTKLISNPIKFGFVFERWEVTGTPMSFDNGLLRMGEEDISLKAIWTPLYTYTGSSNLINDGDGNWRIKFLTSGTLVMSNAVTIDVFCVGGGAGGRNGANSTQGGGGAGYTKTESGIVLMKNSEYPITIGAGSAMDSGARGGTTSAFYVTAGGGYPCGSNNGGGNGGSGGGTPGSSGSFRTGGVNGGNGGSNGPYIGGAGQGTTTREFGEASGALYATGGSGNLCTPTPKTANSGNGGNFQSAGSSGIVVIRNHRTA